MKLALGTKNLTNLSENDIVLKDYLKRLTNMSYIEISLDYDNDFLFKGQIPKNYTVITRVQDCKNIDISLDFHRFSLNLNDYNRYIVLIPMSESVHEGEIYVELKKIYAKYTLGIDNVSSVDQIEDFKLLFGKYPKYVSIRLNPLLYNHDVIKFCKLNGILIIGHEIFGGEIWSGYVRSMFPDGFLLDFARVNSDIAVIPCDSGDFLFPVKVNSRPEPDVKNKVFLYKKNVNKLPKLSLPERKIFGQSTITFRKYGKMTFESNDIMEESYSITKTDPIVELPDKCLLWEDQYISLDDVKGNLGLLSCYHRYHVFPAIDSLYKKYVWKKQFIKIAPDFYFIKLIPKWYLGFLPGEYTLIYIGGKLYKIPSTKLKNLIGDK